MSETVTIQEKLTCLRRALDCARGDDLERAKAAFGHMSEAELNKEWGESGKTPQQILDEYKSHRRVVEATTTWISKLVERETGTQSF